MRILRVGLVLGLLVTASACGGDDDSATSTTATDPSSSTTVTTDPAGTDPPSTTTTTTTTELPTTITEPPATTDPPATTTTPPATTTTPPATTTTPPPTLVDVKVYFLRDERLAIAHRQVEGPAVLRAALAELLAGPTADERAAGLHSEIPAGTTLLDLNLAEGRATVDLSRDLETGGGTLSMTARVAEIIFTATQFDNVDDVVFWLDGEPIDFLGGEGIVLDGPQTRNDVARAFTGGILVDTPDPGATVTSPFTVTGEGDVFEGDFPLEARRDGVRLGDVIVVGAGAWGDWRSFQATVIVDATPGPIELALRDEPGCSPDSEPNCQIFEIVVPLVLAD